MNAKVVNNEIVKTRIKQIVSANIIEVEAGTNGYRGGDTGHGSRTYIRIADLGNTDINFRVIPNAGNGSLIIELGGDRELSTIIKGLKYIIKTLQGQISRYEEKRKREALDDLLLEQLEQM